jgi:hypothetical protein
VWKLKLDNASRQLHNLFPPMIVSDVRTANGPKQIGVVAGVSDNVYGIDLDAGTQLWKRTFDNTFTDQANSRYYTLCPGGLTATPVVGPGAKPGQYIAYAISWDGPARNRASTSPTRSRGTAACVSSTWPPARMPRRRSCSCRRTASRTA